MPKLSLREVKSEVELPCWCSWWIFPLFIHEGKAKLDNLQQINITPQELVLVICITSELSDWSSNYTWELCVL